MPTARRSVRPGPTRPECMGTQLGMAAAPSPAPSRASAPCPCGRTGRTGRKLTDKGKALAYADCCAPWHAGLQAGQGAPDAEALMRSRYSAFVLGLVDYLQATWHPSTCPVDLALEPGVKWLGLTVRRHHQTDECHATVEFVARSRVGGQGQRLHEVSRFVKEGGCWWYVDGNFE